MMKSRTIIQVGRAAAKSRSFGVPSAPHSWALDTHVSTLDNPFIRGFVKNSILLKLRVFACNCMQRRTLKILPQKHVRGFVVRTVVCGA
jgi:hypothetical protein